MLLLFDGVIFFHDRLISQHTCTLSLFTFNKSEAGDSCLCEGIVPLFEGGVFVYTVIQFLYCKEQNHILHGVTNKEPISSKLEFGNGNKIIR